MLAIPAPSTRFLEKKIAENCRFMHRSMILLKNNVQEMQFFFLKFEISN